MMSAGVSWPPPTTVIRSTSSRGDCTSPTPTSSTPTTAEHGDEPARPMTAAPVGRRSPSGPGPAGGPPAPGGAPVPTATGRGGRDGVGAGAQGGRGTGAGRARQPRVDGAAAGGPGCAGDERGARQPSRDLLARALEAVAGAAAGRSGRPRRSPAPWSVAAPRIDAGWPRRAPPEAVDAPAARRVDGRASSSGPRCPRPLTERHLRAPGSPRSGSPSPGARRSPPPPGAGPRPPARRRRRPWRRRRPG